MAAVSFACLAASREAVLRARERHGLELHEPMRVEGRILAEDAAWCQRARDTGSQVWEMMEADWVYGRA